MCGRLTYMYTWGDIRAYLAAHGLEFDESAFSGDGPLCKPPHFLNSCGKSRF